MTNAGVALEARVQRVFLAQGVFAERSLCPAADIKHRLLATDIDVLVSEYSSGFHLTRRHAECKSGRRFRSLDRILWLSGVRAMLGADASYLVLPSFNEDGTQFARNLGVDIMTIRQLETWEKALKIPLDCWPNRSNFETLDPDKTLWLSLGKQENALESDAAVRKAVQFVEIDSWRVFGYSLLNRLLALLSQLSEVANKTNPTKAKAANIRYSVSALLVRLCQYLLAVCYDVSRVPVSNLHSYLANRLTFGDQDPERARGLVQSTVSWMGQALKQRGMTIPPEVDTSRLFQPPTYSDGLVSLVEKLLGAPNEARYLPIAMDTHQFGTDQDTEKLPRLRSASNAGSDLVALVKAFAIASVGLDSAVLTPLGQEAAADRKMVQGAKEDKRSVANQAKLKLQGG